ncbi:hypothetical protein SUGI_0954700 [Cryptomeria japonica]|nr:hypothetical protein SUGI_0954700 [Cryptomeria japonica]
MWKCPEVDKIEGLEHAKSLNKLWVETRWKVPGIQGLENVERLEGLHLKYETISALKPCIQSIKGKECPRIMWIQGGVNHLKESIVNSLELEFSDLKKVVWRVPDDSNDSEVSIPDGSEVSDDWVGFGEDYVYWYGLGEDDFSNEELRRPFTNYWNLWNNWQDVASKIMSFSQQGPCVVCILLANGVISNVTLHQPATSGATLIYEEFQLYQGFLFKMDRLTSQIHNADCSIGDAKDEPSHLTMVKFMC